MSNRSARTSLQAPSRAIKAPSRTALGENVEQAVYFMRTRDDLIKIGHSANLAYRAQQLGGMRFLLALQFGGTYEDEQTLHRQLAEHCARGREVYWPRPAVFDVIDDVRRASGYGPVERWGR